MKHLRLILSGLVGLAVIAALTVPAFASSNARTVHKHHHPAASPVQKVTLYVFRGKEGIPGASDGKSHDTVVPSTFGIKAGVKVEVTVINYDEGTHTFTVPGLGINKVIKGGEVFTTPPPGAGPTELLNMVVPGITHFTFKAKKAGVYRWHCALPCDAGAAGWAMTPDSLGPSQGGFMAGSLVVVG